MKKTAFIIAAIIFVTSPLLGQEKSTNASSSFIGLTGGVSLINGNLVKNDYTDPNSGYANSIGANLGMDGAWYFHKNIGIGGVFSNTAFYCKGLQTMSDGYKEDFDVDSSTVTVSGRYSTTNFLVGPYFSFPFGKITIDLRAVGGLVLAKTPQFRVDLEDQSAATFYQNSSSASAFGVQIGAGIRYVIFQHFSLKLNADYFYSQPDFKITNENRVVNAGRIITAYKQPITGVNINFGIAYMF